MKINLADLKMKAESATTLIRPVPGYNGYYADWEGNIWSAISRWGSWRKISLSPDPDGYLKFKAFGRGRTSAHKLVCLAWHGEKPTPKHEVRHLDGTRNNNNRENLTWGTKSENALDRKTHGTEAAKANGIRSRFKTTGSGDGAYFDKRRNYWYSTIRINGITKYLGSFKSKKEAQEAYEAESRKFKETLSQCDTRAMEA